MISVIELWPPPKPVPNLSCCHFVSCFLRPHQNPCCESEKGWTLPSVIMAHGSWLMAHACYPRLWGPGRGGPSPLLSSQVQGSKSQQSSLELDNYNFYSVPERFVSRLLYSYILAHYIGLSYEKSPWSLWNCMATVTTPAWVGFLGAINRAQCVCGLCDPHKGLWVLESSFANEETVISRI